MWNCLFQTDIVVFIFILFFLCLILFYVILSGGNLFYDSIVVVLTCSSFFSCQILEFVFDKNEHTRDAQKLFGHSNFGKSQFGNVQSVINTCEAMSFNAFQERFIVFH